MDEFHSIPWPDDVQRESSYLKKLCIVEWIDLLAFLSLKKRGVLYRFDIWVVDDYSREAKGPSWTKHLKVGPLVGIHSPVAFLKKDELLMDTDDGLLPRRSLGIFPLMGLNQEHVVLKTI